MFSVSGSNAIFNMSKNQSLMDNLLLQIQTRNRINSAADDKQNNL